MTSDTAKRSNWRGSTGVPILTKVDHADALEAASLVDWEEPRRRPSFDFEAVEAIGCPVPRRSIRPVHVPAVRSAVDDYEYTCFLSYERNLGFDAEGLQTMSAAGEWVHEVLHPALEKWLREECGNLSAAQVAFDGKFQRGENSESAVRERLQRSRVMVAVWSAPYFQSNWCLAEWHSMIARERQHHQGRSLVLPIVFYDGQNFDKAAKDRAQGTKAHAFRRFVTMRRSHTKSLAYAKFITEVQQLCKDIVALAAGAPKWSPEFPWQAPRPPGQPPFNLPSQQS